MARLQDLAVGRKDLYMVDPLIIREKDSWNVRNDTPEFKAHIRMLADSIKEIGVQSPLTVYMDGDNPVLTDGHCRLMAVMLAITEGAEIKSVPCRLEERYADEADRTLSLLTRNSGMPLAPMEQAEVVKRLLSFGWDEKQVSVKSGKSITHIQNLISLLAAPVEVKEMVKRGEVAATLAVETVRKHENATEILQTAVETAKSAGKEKASKKHLPASKPVIEKSEDVIDGVAGGFAVRRQDSQEAGTCEVAGDKQTDSPADSIPGLKGYTFWEQWGPRCQKYLEKFRDAESVAELQQMQVDLRHFLAGMGRG